MTVARIASGWWRDLKRQLGYYRLRTRLLAPRFDAALRPTDTFLVGHPKSGNTWLAYMLAVLIERDRADRVTLANVGQFVPFVHGRDDRIRRFGHLRDPRTFRNEYPRYWCRYPRIIYLVRDPRAVLPSLWQMYRTVRGDLTTEFDAFLEQYLAGRGLFRHWNSDLVRWDRQVASVLDEAGRTGRILVVRYEEMAADREAVLRNVASFIALDRSPADFARAVSRGAFEAMRNLEDRHGAEAYLNRAKGPGRFVRIGGTEGWREELSAPAISAIETAFRPVMRRAGYLD
ncbi:MAG: sulfotransferase domain-containing protein [Gemmatimonadetes bacterium]|nr:sulfotransferase domain-containing protein [Gemmatimonadota bacterium]